MGLDRKRYRGESPALDTGAVYQQVGRRDTLSAIWNTSYIDALFLFAIILTVALVVFNRFYVARLVLPLSDAVINLIDDVDVGGRSYGKMISRDQLRWQCELQDGFLRPYCGVNIVLTQNLRKGIDLSAYERFVLDLNYQGKGESIRIQLRNFNPAYSQESDPISTQYNLVELQTALLDSPLTFDLNYFKVADWWAAKYNVPFDFYRPDLSNIVMIQVQTGTMAPSGKHEFQLKSITLERQFIPSSQLYFALMVFWFGVSLILLSGRLRRKHIELQRYRYRAAVFKKEKELLGRLADDLSDKARRDVLTGVLNRGGLNAAVDEFYRVYQEHEVPFSFILFDVDYFKRINDSFGHHIGDLVLKELVTVVQSSIRKGDILGRWGGEEFLIVCPDMVASEAKLFAEKLKDNISSYAFPQDLKLTCSFGVTCIETHRSVDSLFQAADAALYQAKHNGRNCVFGSSSNFCSTSSPAATKF